MNTNDADLFDLIKKKLFTAVIGDVCDAMGLTRQFLPPSIKPLAQNMQVCGRAMTVLEADCFGERLQQATGQGAFGLMLEALDALQPNDVYICTGSSPTYALWGELMSTRALKLGAVGAVMNGYSRDSAAILKLNFPVFSYGCYAQDQRIRGRVIDYNCRLAFDNGVQVEPGDIIIGDIDGVLIVPRAHEKEIIERALEKVSGENLVRKAILEGMSTVEAWNRFGIM